jgi:hypothetical protein
MRVFGSKFPADNSGNSQSGTNAGSPPARPKEAHLKSKCTNIYDVAEVERVFYPEIEKLLLEFFPDATDALVYNHDVFDKDRLTFPAVLGCRGARPRFL